MSDDILKRLERADEYEPLGVDGWKAADEITRLRADLAAERDRNGIITQAAQEVTNALRAENEKLREALIDTIASLVASVSLLERGGKKAAPSDTMFAQMLIDYKNSIDRARAALESITETPNVP